MLYKNIEATVYNLNMMALIAEVLSYCTVAQRLLAYFPSSSIVLSEIVTFDFTEGEPTVTVRENNLCLILWFWCQ